MKSMIGDIMDQFGPISVVAVGNADGMSKYFLDALMRVRAGSLYLSDIDFSEVDDCTELLKKSEADDWKELLKNFALRTRMEKRVGIAKQRNKLLKQNLPYEDLLNVASEQAWLIS